MSTNDNQPSKADFLAALLTGNAELSQSHASVQRSHRFPLHLFVQIENMARLGGVPVSLIINQLLECGLEAVREKLSPEVAREVAIASSDQLERPLTTERAASAPRKASDATKAKRTK